MTNTTFEELLSLYCDLNYSSLKSYSADLLLTKYQMSNKNEYNQSSIKRSYDKQIMLFKVFVSFCSV